MPKASKSNKYASNAPKADFSGDTIIRFEGVSFEHGHNKPILDEVSFTVRRGTKITLMGQNGAGKTTIFGLILDELKPESGEVHISRGATIATARQVIPRPDLELTVREFFAKSFKENKYDLDPRIDEVLDVVNLKVPKNSNKSLKLGDSEAGGKGHADPSLLRNDYDRSHSAKAAEGGVFSAPLLKSDGKSVTLLESQEGDVLPAGIENGAADDVAGKMSDISASQSIATEKSHKSRKGNKPLKSASEATHTDFKDRMVKTFSGGQQARLLLASALIQDPDILLLDEPTNNLDKAGIEHLTKFLIDYQKTCLVISHDAEFLNAFTHGVLYLDVHTRKVEQYVGDYKDVVEQISVRIEAENRENARLGKEIQAKKDQAGMFAMKGGGLRLVAKRMRLLAEELEEEIVEVRKEDKTIKPFVIPAQQDTVGDIITISSYSIISPKNHKPVTRTCDIHLRRKNHLLIVGPNGIGKSSLLEAIVRGGAAQEGKVEFSKGRSLSERAEIAGAEGVRLQGPARGDEQSREASSAGLEKTTTLPDGAASSSRPLSCKSMIAPGIRVGYYRQDFSMMDFNDTVYQSLEKIVRATQGRLIETELRATAASFLISADAIHTRIGSLSEGQKGLVAFARLVLQKPGLLILDEPTNHINFRHLPVIAKALDAYEGAMILVSHVPEFVKQIRIDEILEMGK